MRTIRNLIGVSLLLLMAIPEAANAAGHSRRNPAPRGLWEELSSPVLYLRHWAGRAAAALSWEKSRGTMDPNGLQTSATDPGTDSRGTMDPNG
jgi:hypothetical protein